ncbi:TY-Chap domain-containing protein [Nocardia sp. NPDC004123]
MTSWDEFARRLAYQFAILPDGAILLIDTDEPDTQPGFAQFAQFEDMLHAELGAYADLDRNPGLHNPGHQLALRAGWHPPDIDWDNWWFQVPRAVQPVAGRELAAMVIVGLRDAFHVPSPDRLVYTAWNARAGNRPLDLPLLGIAKQ